MSSLHIKLFGIELVEPQKRGSRTPVDVYIDFIVGTSEKFVIFENLGFKKTTGCICKCAFDMPHKRKVAIHLSKDFPKFLS